MNRNFHAFTIILFAILALTLRDAPAYSNEKDKGKSDKPEIEWLTFDEGVERAKKEKKLLVIDFYTDWCSWCRVMDKDTYGNEAVVNYAQEKLIMAKLNAETKEKFKFRDATYSGRELSMMFGVTGFPATVFMSAEGEFLTKVSGFIPADRFKSILQYFAENWYEKMSFEEFEKKLNQSEIEG